VEIEKGTNGETIHKSIRKHRINKIENKNIKENTNIKNIIKHKSSNSKIT
jgi:hypothetical protein